MYRMFLLCFAFFIGRGIRINAQVSEGVPCETPNSQYGLCISIYTCRPLMNLLITQSSNTRVRTFLRASQCGRIGETPLVCCPEVKKEENPVPVFTSTTEVSEETRTPRTNSVFSLPRRPQCGHGNETTPRVINGQPAKLGEFPWIVALGYRNSKNPDSPKWLCGGTLITDRHVLTAAHCVYKRQDLYIARLGDLDLYDNDDGANPETIPFVSAKIHENYNPVQFTTDIAILTLARSPRPTTAWPICLPVEDDLRNNNFVKSIPTVAGWGSTEFNGPSSSILREVTIPVLDNNVCKNAYGNRSVIDGRILCAGYIRGGKDACQGDSGGPLMHRTVYDGDIWFYQIGIVSYGLRCAEAGYPGVYTRVTAFLDWIQKNIN